MGTVNYPVNGDGQATVAFPLVALSLDPVSGQEAQVRRVQALRLEAPTYALLRTQAQYLGVSDRFTRIIEACHTPPDHTPPGFRVELELLSGGLLQADLIRDISYDADSRKRPTSLIFSADSANPYEVEPIAPMLGNLTCNPGIVYDLFINNPEANVGHKFNTRDEVIAELGRILGPGVDVSVELNNPFEDDFGKILEECETFKEILGEHRLVVKVPHTGPVNATNVHQLLRGDKRLDIRHDRPATADALRGHNLALRLREHGYRINFTLMFEPHQTALALQAKPAFINSFIRHRAKQSDAIKAFLEAGDREGLRTFLLANDYLASNETDLEFSECEAIARELLEYRRVDDPYGADGLDGVRHSLRWLRQSNLPDTRLIICSMEGSRNFPDIDNLLADPEYADMVERVVLTAEPAYLARFTSSNQVVSYQRRFMNAAASA